MLLGLLAGLGFVAVVAITNPWIFTVGGRFRALPFWQGVGDIQGPGGKYRIFVSIQPSYASSHLLPSTSVRGSGWICGPSGRSYQIRVGGGAHEVVWRDMNNKSFTLDTWRKETWSAKHLPPKLSLVGHWMGPSLIMDDTGTIASAFLQDGSLNPRPGPPGLKRAITFVETPWWFGRPCTGHASERAN